MSQGSHQEQEEGEEPLQDLVLGAQVVLAASMVAVAVAERGLPTAPTLALVVTGGMDV